MKTVLIGGGGHARVLLDALRSAGQSMPELILDARPELKNTEVMGVPVGGTDELLESLAGKGFTHFLIGIGGRGNGGVRPKLYERAQTCGLKPRGVVHATAIISAEAEIADDAQILAGSIVNASAKIDRGVIVNTAAVVEHDCEVGAFTHIAPRVCLGGGVHVGAHVHLGIGAVVREGIRIGEGSLIGAGAVVISDVPAGAVVMGVPAKEKGKC